MNSPPSASSLTVLTSGIPLSATSAGHGIAEAEAGSCFGMSSTYCLSGGESRSIGTVDNVPFSRRNCTLPFELATKEALSARPCTSVHVLRSSAATTSVAERISIVEIGRSLVSLSRWRPRGAWGGMGAWQRVLPISKFCPAESLGYREPDTSGNGSPRSPASTSSSGAPRTRTAITFHRSRAAERCRSNSSGKNRNTRARGPDPLIARGIPLGRDQCAA